MGIWCRANIFVICKTAENFFFVISAQVNDVNKSDFAIFFARIVTAFEYSEVEQVTVFDFQALD